MARDYDHCGCILARRGGRFGARGGGRGAMKTAKPQVGSVQEATGLGARAHRLRGQNSCDDEGVWGRIARIVASGPKTLQAPSYVYM